MLLNGNFSTFGLTRALLPFWSPLYDGGRTMPHSMLTFSSNSLSWRGYFGTILLVTITALSPRLRAGLKRALHKSFFPKGLCWGPSFTCQNPRLQLDAEVCNTFLTISLPNSRQFTGQPWAVYVYALLCFALTGLLLVWWAVLKFIQNKTKGEKKENYCHVSSWGKPS